MNALFIYLNAQFVAQNKVWFSGSASTNANNDGGFDSRTFTPDGYDMSNLASMKSSLVADLVSYWNATFPTDTIASTDVFLMGFFTQ